MLKNLNVRPFLLANYVYEDEGANVFLTIGVNDNEALGLLWNTQTSAGPEVKEFPDLNVIIISVSNYVFIISTLDGSLKFKTALSYDIDFVFVNQFGIWLQAEIELRRVDKITYAITNFDVPDVIDGISFIKNEVVVTGVTGQVFRKKL